MTVLEVAVPDGIGPGDDFVIQFEGLDLSVQCPDGCKAGDAITIDVDVPSQASAQPQVEVVIPDGCLPGMQFTVDFDGRSFDIAVPVS